MINPKVSMEKEEIDFLKKVIGKNKVIVEVGCYVGKTTGALAEDNIVIAIDPFISGYEPNDPPVMDLDGVEKCFRAEIKDKNVIWYKKESEEVLKFWNLTVDGVFIDGEHTTRALSVDVKWLEHVKSGGIIAFHDYNFFSDVTDFVDKHIIPKYEEIGREGFLIIFRKQ